MRHDYVRRLGRLCDTWGEKLIVRFYGFDGTTFDASILRDMPQIRALIVNCIYDDVDNLAIIGERLCPRAWCNSDVSTG